MFLGNGSDEVLAHAFYVFFQQGLPLLRPDISYSFYRVYCQLYGIPVEMVPLRDDLRLEVGDYEGRDAARVAGVVIANQLAIAGGVAAFEDHDYVEQTRQAVMSSREGLALSLEDLGFKVLPSQANFVFATHPVYDAAWLAGALRDRGVLVRHFKKARIDAYRRISVGTPAQCDQLISAMRAVLAEAV